MEQEPIGLDLDEVVFNYVDPFLAFVNERRKTAFTRKDVISYSFESCGILPPDTNDDFVGEFGDKGHLRTLPLMEGAEEFIRKLIEARTVYYVTSRDFKYSVDTKHALDRAGIWCPVAYSNRAFTKAMHVKQLRISCLADDSPRFVKEVASKTKARAILYSNVPGSIVECEKQSLPIARTWEELYQMIVE